MQRPIPLSLVAFAVVVLAAVALVIVLQRRTPPAPGMVREKDGFAVIEIRGAIDARLARRAQRALQELERRGVDDVVVVLDSPGGEIDAAHELAEAFLHSPVTTHGLLGNAVGGAAQPLAALDHLYCLPTAIISGPNLAPIHGPIDPMVAGIQRAILSQMQAAARTKGHDVEVITALADAQAELIREGKVWKQAGTFFVLTAADALALKLSQGTFPTVETLITHLQARVAEPAP